MSPESTMMITWRNNAMLSPKRAAGNNDNRRSVDSPERVFRPDRPCQRGRLD